MQRLNSPLTWKNWIRQTANKTIQNSETNIGGEKRFLLASASSRRTIEKEIVTSQ